MARQLWCWRCRQTVPMLESHEWAVIEKAREAGAHYATVLEHARANLPLGHTFTPLRPHAGASQQRMAPLLLGHELFTGGRPRPLEMLHHRIDLYGPPCSTCGKPLRTPIARRCASCGHPSEQDSSSASANRQPCVPNTVLLHGQSLRTITVADILDGPLPPDQWDPIATRSDLFLLALANPAFGLVNHDVAFRLVSPTAQQSEPARMIQALYSFRRAVLSDLLFDYLREDQGANDLPDVTRWCEEIGATRAQSFAQALLDLYPAAIRVTPRERGKYLDDLDVRVGYEVPQRLAEARWDDVVEIPERLRAFIRTHLQMFEAALVEGRAIARQADAMLRDQLG